MNWKYNNPKFEYEEKFQDLSWPWSGHKFFAYDLISNVKPGVVVELGTHYGTSLWSFCQAVKDNNLQTKIFSVDTWKGEKHAGFYGEEVFETVNEIKDKYYNGVNLKLRRMTFDEALGDFEDNSIDVLHIDGLHTYEAVKHDFERWLPKVKEGGIVLLHDIMVNRDDFGVYKLWEELKNNYKTIEFQFSYGLGVLIKGDNAILGKRNELINHYSYFLSDFEREELNKKDFFIKEAEEANNLNRKKIEEVKKIAEEKENIRIEQEEEIKNLKNDIIQKEEIIIEKIKEAEEIKKEIELKKIEVVELKNSTSWKITKPMRSTKDKILRIIDLGKYAFAVYKEEGICSLIKRITRFLFKKIRKVITHISFKNKYNKFSSISKKIIYIYKTEGITTLLKKTFFYFKKRKTEFFNQDNAERIALDIFNNQQKEYTEELINKEIESFKFKPLLSIVMPVYNTPPQWLEIAIESLEKQLYENWELCIVDDFSTNENTKKILKKHENNKKLKIFFSEKNSGISKS